MNRTRKIIAGLTLGAVLITGAAFAATPIAQAYKGLGGPKSQKHLKYTEMTSEQQARLLERHQQRVQWLKQDLQAAVQAGKITQTEADARLTIMQERFKAFQAGRQKESIGLKGKNYPYMTPEQKAEFVKREQVKINWRKQDLQADVQAGKITQAEADAKIAKMNNHLQNIQDGKFQDGKNRFKGPGNQQPKRPGMGREDCSRK